MTRSEILSIEQFLVMVGPNGPEVVARSPSVGPRWEEAGLTTTVRFGRRPAGVACPAALFAVPVGRSHVAVVQVADQPSGSDREAGLGFRFLILTRNLYDSLGDPFAIDDRFPPDWSVRGQLATLEWTSGPLPQRKVAQVQEILKSGDTPLLLGGTQALIDGGRLLFLPADTPDPKAIFQQIWQLLPERTRIELWPATFAFSNDLGFHAVALPESPSPWPMGYLTADQARDYPEGRYELALQIAIESGDQPELDRLYARRSSSDTLRLAIYLVLGAFVAAAISKFLL